MKSFAEQSRDVGAAEPLEMRYGTILHRTTDIFRRFRIDGADPEILPAGTIFRRRRERELLAVGRNLNSPERTARREPLFDGSVVNGQGIDLFRAAIVRRTIGGSDDQMFSVGQKIELADHPGALRNRLHR